MEEKLVSRLVQVGVRTATAHQRDQIKRFNVETVEMRNFRDDLTFSFDGPVYISFDVDGLDPSLVSATGTPEPGGLGWYETIGLIRTLARKRRVVGMDLTEYSYVEGQNASAFLCAKLIYKTLGFVFKKETVKVRGKQDNAK